MTKNNVEGNPFGHENGCALDLSLRLFAVNEIQERLGLSRSRVYELLNSGALRSVQIGRSRRVPARDLADYIELLRSEGESVVGGL